MLDYKNLPIGENAPALINAVVEIPKGSTNGSEYDPEPRRVSPRSRASLGGVLSR